MKFTGRILTVAALAMIGSPLMAQDSDVDVEEIMQEVEEVLEEVSDALDEAGVMANFGSELRNEIRNEVRNELRLELGMDDDDDDDSKKRRRFRTDGSWNLELGLNNMMIGDFQFPGADNEPYALRPLGSRYVAITRNWSTKLAGPLYIEYGSSVSWYNFMWEDPATRVTMDPDGLVFSDVNDMNPDIIGDKSKLVAPYVNAHFVPVIDLSRGTFNRSYQGRGLRIGAGGYVGYRIGGYTKTKFEQNGDTQKFKDRDSYYLESLRYGVRGQLGFRGVDLFVNYDLNNIFNENRGPEANAVSFGLIF